MIVVEEPRSLLVVTQTDHAHLAGELLSLWILDELPGHPRREALLLATREHDNGWREADAAPRLDRMHQRPHDFRSFPLNDHFEVWKRGIERFSRQRPYVALLIAHHAGELYRLADEVPESWELYLPTLAESRQQWMVAAAVSETDIERDYRFLQTADLLSLALCSRWRHTLDTGLVAATASDDTLQLRPFPLAGATTLGVPCRRIPRRPYHGDADLGGELAAARWEELPIHLVPATYTP
jgi:hypothetical protein